LPVKEYPIEQEVHLVGLFPVQLIHPTVHESHFPPFIKNPSLHETQLFPPAVQIRQLLFEHGVQLVPGPFL
jgi:hypothetical protein